MADIVLKDRNGKDVTYEGIETVTFDTTAEGVQATFTEGIAMEGLEIAPNFTGGDMPIAAPEGTLVKSAIIKMPEYLTPENVRKGKEIGGVSGSFIGDTEEITVDLYMADGDQVIVPSADGKVISKVTVKRPETYVEENIAEDVDIGGIVGAFAGGGANVVYNSGTFTGLTDAEPVINHDLGVVPDIVIIYTSGQSSSNSSHIKSYIGVSSAFAQAIGNVFSHCAVVLKYVTTYTPSGSSGIYKAYSQSTYAGYAQTAVIDSAALAFVSFVNRANTNSFTLKNGGGSVFFDSKLTYNWLAIGGLTEQ